MGRVIKISSRSFQSNFIDGISMRVEVCVECVM